jgi:hypothetical protein
MKNHFLAIMLVAVVMGILSLSFTYNKANFKTSIVISENETTYNMAAKYDESKTAQLITYVDDCLKPDLLFSNKQQMDEKIILKDRTTFYFRFSPGEIKIKLIKSENTATALIKIKKLCAGLNGVLNR